MAKQVNKQETVRMMKIFTDLNMLICKVLLKKVCSRLLLTLNFI